MLKGSEAHHLQKVMRAGKGDIFCAVDGLGKCYRSVITGQKKNNILADVVSVTRNENEPLMEITVGVALLKNNIMDYAIEKATECGVSKFIPFRSSNTVVEIPEKQGIIRKRKRWQNVVRAAVKQSLRTRIPEISDPVKFKEMISGTKEYDLKLLADPGKNSIALKDIKFKKPKLRVLLIVGPEAGFTVEELADAKQFGFRLVHFGSRRLRAETAAALFPLLLLQIAGDLN
ncbi:MAG: 16S rRNA (uracil(1498)-N(3))-methyltransferase [candidate division Zixibacteria bacterium]|nr:16S rRNA (uracil(1498)-N(3))-methyltransferase [candidate division Zixibacteria bacterium]